jgi:hypothetical protein
MASSPIPLLALLTLAACTPVGSQESPPSGTVVGEEPPVLAGPGLDAPSCDAAKAQDFVGRKADESTVQGAMAASGAKVVRVLRPGVMVTQEYRGDRLNLQLDGNGLIASATCG